MSEKRVYRITPTNRRHVAEQVSNLPDGYVIKAGPPTRSLEQNALLHVMFGELAKQGRYIGRQLTLNQWKTLMISGHAMATGLGADVIPGIEGEFVNIRESSAQMSVARMTSLIEYIHAWAAVNNVQFKHDY
jgi:hypothetical protein